ncbi:LysR family transcriptional regulator [Nocardia terpenica]|uniref:LysR substrate-binding domain-containing protein n=1 Tax=Nocardia terpenica TaxID=455432 RepID=UPI0018944E5C|nr:LysR substrate-binding domain-containing protein [Nocardia terpenica]MBF6066042.1 LysR family transcriptional regulator [Nocardia terpenica]MBF6109031.1 LysR family transcriptional regulator [Nocardia terpenica]MBF6116286.1 LysR family transcriptional regulator [Nocardia terpenica]MBF6123287.1 LysR family transcriptional regulator [Nocardia terpenica]MBF6156530.1 LysR family transcriptional regulator [Nocardia terpenica]
MELRQLRYFVTVAEELHFGRAAERLHIAQPAVSQQVRRLERELRVQLLDRSPRRVRLTEAGLRFLPAARDVLAAADRARATVAGLAGQRAEVFRLGTITGLGERLDTVLDVFAERLPQLQVELVSLPVRERLEHVADGRLDAAFVRSPSPADSPELEFLPAWDDPLMVVLPARHPLAARETVALADLAAVPLRMTERRNHPALVDLVLTACQRAGFEPVPAPTSTTLQDNLAAIGSGAPMWTVVYASNARLVHNPRVAFRPFTGDGLSLPIALAVRPGANSPGPALLRALLDTAESPGYQPR